MDERFRRGGTTPVHTERGGRSLRRVRRALPLAALAILVATAGRADAAVSEHDLQAKMAYCKTCHGVSEEHSR